MPEMNNTEISATFAAGLFKQAYANRMVAFQAVHMYELQKMVEPTLQYSQRMSLSAALRQTLEPIFGFKLGEVGIHVDAVAQQAADLLGARAFARGKEIYFGNNEDHFSAASGLALLAHELTHIGQQSGKTAIGGTSHADHEVQADAVENRFLKTLVTKPPKAKPLQLETLNINTQDYQLKEELNHFRNIYREMLEAMIWAKLSMDPDRVKDIIYNDVYIDEINLQMTLNNDECGLSTCLGRMASLAVDYLRNKMKTISGNTIHIQKPGIECKKAEGGKDEYLYYVQLLKQQWLLNKDLDEDRAEMLFGHWLNNNFHILGLRGYKASGVYDGVEGTGAAHSNKMDGYTQYDDTVVIVEPGNEKVIKYRATVDPGAKYSADNPGRTTMLPGIYRYKLGVFRGGTKYADNDLETAGKLFLDYIGLKYQRDQLLEANKTLNLIQIIYKLMGGYKKRDLEIAGLGRKMENNKKELEGRFKAARGEDNFNINSIECITRIGVNKKTRPKEDMRAGDKLQNDPWKGYQRDDFEISDIKKGQGMYTTPGWWLWQQPCLRPVLDPGQKNYAWEGINGEAADNVLSQAEKDWCASNNADDNYSCGSILIHCGSGFDGKDDKVGTWSEGCQVIHAGKGGKDYADFINRISSSQASKPVIYYTLIDLSKL